MVSPFSSPVCVRPARINRDADLKNAPCDSTKLMSGSSEPAEITEVELPLNSTTAVWYLVLFCSSPTCWRPVSTRPCGA